MYNTLALKYFSHECSSKFLSARVLDFKTVLRSHCKLSAIYLSTWKVMKIDLRLKELAKEHGKIEDPTSS